MVQFSPPQATTALAARLAERIERDGPISLHDYMAACLYDPSWGYYRKRRPIGTAGDFVTAPEISQAFGELIGLWCAEVWRLMGKPAEVRVVELGPGRGTLISDALRALRAVPEFLARATVHLVEVSDSLRAEQALKIAGAPCPVIFHESLAEVPAGPSIVVANEYLDCLPIRQFVFDGVRRGWCERMVGFGGRGFSFVVGNAASDITHLPEAETCEEGDIFEVRPGADNFVDELAARAQQAPVSALLVDYGHTRPSLGDSLQAVRRHAFAGVFDAPGETDLTAHVDFHRLVERACETALRHSGPMPLGEWLLRLGIEVRANQLLRAASPEDARQIVSGVRRLLDPAQMGVLFKTLVLWDGLAEPPPPFHVLSAKEARA